jgi:hypothetical protein
MQKEKKTKAAVKKLGERSIVKNLVEQKIEFLLLRVELIFETK